VLLAALHSIDSTDRSNPSNPQIDALDADAGAARAAVLPSSKPLALARQLLGGQYAEAVLEVS
jgi:hypothetical protein